MASSKLNTSQRLHLLMLSHWGLRTSTYDYWGDTNILSMTPFQEPPTLNDFGNQPSSSRRGGFWTVCKGTTLFQDCLPRAMLQVSPSWEPVKCKRA